MKLLKKNIEGLYLIKSDIFNDKRGSLRRSFCKNYFKSKKIIFDVLQGNISENRKKGTLRGFHFQKNNKKDNKILTCISGTIFNITIDLRKKSKTFLKKSSTILSSRNKYSILVPSGCANAFLTLENNTVIHYYMNDYFKKKNDCGVRFNDPIINIKWPIKPKIISKRDLSFPDFKCL